MQKKEARNWRLLMLAIFLLAWGARLLPGLRTIDDAFITYRYARNILAGTGFVYNPGERVLGTTTPLYTFLMATMGSVTGGVQAPFAQLSMLINALADAGTCLLLMMIGRRLGYPYAGVGTGLAWAVAPFSVTFAIGGLETSVYILLLVSMVYIHITRRHILAAFLAALALLTRPDALILIGLLALDRGIQVLLALRRQRRDEETIASPQRTPLAMTWKSLGLELLVFCVPVLAWIIFSTIYFGNPLPHSIAAKTLAYHLPPEAGFVRLLQHYATPFLDHLTFGNVWIGVGMVLYPVLFLIGMLGALRKESHIWPFAAYPWAYFAAFAIANPLIFRWYMTPPLPAYFLFILIGAERLIRESARAFDRRHRRLPTPGAQPAGQVTRAALVFFVVLSPALLQLRDWQAHPDHGLPYPAPSMAWYKLELLYQQVANELAPEIQSKAGAQPVLAAGDVGVLGFYSGARILDTVGLNSAQSTGYYPLDDSYYVINYAIPPDLIIDARPDYVVILEVYGRNGLLRDKRFQEGYTLREKIPSDIYGSDGLLVFERNPQ